MLPERPGKRTAAQMHRRSTILPGKAVPAGKGFRNWTWENPWPSPVGTTGEKTSSEPTDSKSVTHHTDKCPCCPTHFLKRFMFSRPEPAAHYSPCNVRTSRRLPPRFRCSHR
jgi:hypothetical protein